MTENLCLPSTFVKYINANFFLYYRKNVKGPWIISSPIAPSLNGDVLFQYANAKCPACTVSNPVARISIPKRTSNDPPVDGISPP